MEHDQASRDSQLAPVQDPSIPSAAPIVAKVDRAGGDQALVVQLVAAHPDQRAAILTRLHTTFGNGFVQEVMAKLDDLGEHIKVAGGEAVGVAELAGFRYPVKPYEAQVDQGLFRGSRLDDAGMAALEAQGIRGVVNLCLENNDDAPRAAKCGLTALHVPILDNTAPTTAQMDQFVAFARANPPTYVHCEAGKGRTGTAVACYRIAVDGWTADRAIAEARTFGLSLINQIAFIREYERSLHR